MDALLRIPTEFATIGSLGLVAYHHVGYPLLLRALRKPTTSPVALAVEAWPAMTVIMPAYNEAAHIVAKLRNLAALDYPAGKLRVLVLCDGCTDATAGLARSALGEPDCAGLDAQIVEHFENRGKVAVLNEGIMRARGEIVVLTDVSALLPKDALRRAAAHFADPRLGAVGGTYRLETGDSEGEAAYWRMQLGVKRGEAAMGAPLGLHGAFYAIRRVAWTPLPGDTINDDFILPMEIFARGWRVAYDERIVAIEAEGTSNAAALRRRGRIAAGNAQQLVRLAGLLHPRHGGVAFAFASGKALRVVMPLLILVGALGSLALSSLSPIFMGLAGLQLAGFLVAVLGMMQGARAPRPFALAAYVVGGHMASLGGLWRYATGQYKRPWTRIVESLDPSMHLPTSVIVAKRSLDIGIAGLALVLTAPLWPLLALAIRLDSPGPVLFSQLRVGRVLNDRTELFRMLKFRSMYTDAEARSGAVWATQNDPRITRVGRFLRKTRLDEIPQLLNVLAGHMSIVGPRPERPGFYGRLERAIPFFADRTVGLRPGITGLAQVNQGYDTTIDDVRRKVTFDHAYAMRLVTAWSWLSSDLGIMVRTFTVMATGRGQ